MIALYSLALLVSAALLFLLEPMVGKFVLPLLGSAPEVWPSTVLFSRRRGWPGTGRARDEPTVTTPAGPAPARAAGNRPAVVLLRQEVGFDSLVGDDTPHPRGAERSGAIAGTTHERALTPRPGT